MPPRAHLHLTNEAILIDRPPLLPARRPRRLRPHLLDVLEHHIAVAIEGLDARQQLAVVAARDEHLGVGTHGGLEDGERAGCEFVFFELGDLVFADRGVRERRRDRNEGGE